MGIHCLFPFLQKYSKKVKLREFTGQTVCIDASCWLHKGLSVSVAQSGNRARYADIFRSYLRSVKNAGVIPIVVFDGFSLPAKAHENERRRREKQDRLKKAGEANTSEEEANKLRSQAVEICFSDVTECINICLEESAKYIVAPYESDAQMAFFVNRGYADFVLTEDSDLLTYGCKKVLVKFSMNGDGELFHLDEILSGLNLSMACFQQMCIAAGCDYLKNLNGIGINRAFQMASHNGNVLNALKSKGADEEYCEKFKNAVKVFCHQTVFDMATCSTIPLEIWDTNPSSDLQYICGLYLDSSFANEVASGNVNTKTKEKVNNYPLFTKTTIAVETKTIPAQSEVKTDAHNEPLHCEIIHVDRVSSFAWKVPCFPVMTLEFVKVLFKQGSTMEQGVVQKCVAPELKSGKYLCSAHCQIDVAEIKYTVLWKLSETDTADTSVPDTQSPGSDNSSCNEDSNSEPEESTVITHRLPFKVMGTCYSSKYQKALQEAYDYLYEHNRHIFAKLEAEPENPHDTNAIAVYIMSSSDYEKVGYLASELTRFVHPLLKDPTLKVTVKQIRFCTTFLMIGFYLTIDITRTGLWEKSVIKASRKVK